jgi:hypothetical protein
MKKMFNNLRIDHYEVGVVAIITSIIVVVVCQICTKKLLGEERIKQCHEVGGHYLAIVGGFYAVHVDMLVAPPAPHVPPAFRPT